MDHECDDWGADGGCLRCEQLDQIEAWERHATAYDDQPAYDDEAVYAEEAD